MNSRNIFARCTSHFRFYRGKALVDFLHPKSHASHLTSEYHHWSPIVQSSPDAPTRTLIVSYCVDAAPDSSSYG